MKRHSNNQGSLTTIALVPKYIIFSVEPHDEQGKCTTSPPRQLLFSTVPVLHHAYSFYISPPMFLNLSSSSR